MSIFNKNPNELFKDFVDYINWVLNKTITEHPLFWVSLGPSYIAQMQFTRSKAVKIGSSPFSFSIVQTLVANNEHNIKEFERQYRLETHEYHYHIYRKTTKDPIVRFEYERKLRWKAKHCRHHCHLLFKKWGINFKKVHVPTGWVLIEDLIRFIIVDLGCPTLCNEEKWRVLLDKSEDDFFKNRSSKEINPQNMTQ